MSRKVLLISPHYPPDATAGAHRMRVLAPYLAPRGWTPTVLTVDPRDYEGELDLELAERIGGAVEVIRVRAWPVAVTRAAGFGDLGLRAYVALRRAAQRLMRQRRFDAVYITTYPIYPAAIGPALSRRFGMPFVLDLQDPWVGAWGDTVGPAPGRTPDVRSRLSRAAAVHFERRVIPHASALTGVSSQLLADLAGRYPEVADRPCVQIPIGFDPADLDWIERHPRAVSAAAPSQRGLQIGYVGTLLPLGVETIRAVLDAAASLARARQGLERDLHLRFVGTSNQARADATGRVKPLAEEAGAGRLVEEWPARIPFLDALRVVRSVHVVLLAGTSEARYTASKADVALASGRPILAVLHEKSDVTSRLRPLAERDRSVRLITYRDRAGIARVVDEIRAALADWLQAPPRPRAADPEEGRYWAPALAGQLAAVLDHATATHHD